MTAPDPEPPAVVRVTAVPTALVLVVLETVRVACGPLKVKTTGSDVLLAYKPWAAFVATTEHCVGWLAVTVAPVKEHKALAAESA